MPQPGMRWRHIIINTHCSWLPGDARGFRNHGHRLHSSGDYRNPPPPEEHAGLRRHAQQISGQPVTIPARLRPIVGKAIVERLHKLNLRVLVLSVSGQHAHMLVELPDDPKQIKHLIGQCKTSSSLKVQKDLPGGIWGAGLTYEPVDDPDHHRNVYRYILKQKGAWTWSFKDAPHDEEPSDSSHLEAQPRSSEPQDLREQETPSDSSRLEAQPRSSEPQDLREQETPSDSSRLEAQPRSGEPQDLREQETQKEQQEQEQEQEP